MIISIKNFFITSHLFNCHYTQYNWNLENAQAKKKLVKTAKIIGKTPSKTIRMILNVFAYSVETACRTMALELNPSTMFVYSLRCNYFQ